MNKVYIIFVLLFIGNFSWSHPSLLILKDARAENASWSTSMRNLQSNLTELEPYLFNIKDYNDPTKQEFLKKRFAELAKNSKNISHNPTLIEKDPTVRFVANQFSSDLERASLSFAEGKTEFARYQVIKVTSLCVQCHTRMQQGMAFTFKKSEAFFKLMPPSEQAEYLIASRRFTQAYDLMIKQLENTKEGKPTPWQVDKMADLAMLIAVQYEQSIVKAEKIIDVIQKNSNTPNYMQEKIKAWKKSIATWKSEKKKLSTVEDYRKVLDHKNSDVDAMRILPQLLTYLSGSLPPEKLAEGLLLAGESYEVLNPISLLDLHENYYESCIENAPHTAIAKKCFAKLQNSLQIGYSGSSGINIPFYIEVRLNKLKKKAE